MAHTTLQESEIDWDLNSTGFPWSGSAWYFMPQIDIWQTPKCSGIKWSKSEFNFWIVFWEIETQHVKMEENVQNSILKTLSRIPHYSMLVRGSSSNSPL